VLGYHGVGGVVHRRMTFMERLMQLMRDAHDVHGVNLNSLCEMLHLPNTAEAKHDLRIMEDALFAIDRFWRVQCVSFFVFCLLLINFTTVPRLFHSWWHWPQLAKEKPF
jgi:hypothetical protein